MEQVNQRPALHPAYASGKPVSVGLYADERWSYGGSKRSPRWRWWVQDGASAEVVGFVFGRRTHATFDRLRQLLVYAGLRVAWWISDAWWAYGDRLPAEQRVADKTQLQRLERKHLTLRTRLKRLTRKTICFSKKAFFHDGIISLFIHHFFFHIPDST
jgi:insertion element IS1 protein InsB